MKKKRQKGQNLERGNKREHNKRGKLSQFLFFHTHTNEVTALLPTPSVRVHVFYRAVSRCPPVEKRYDDGDVIARPARMQPMQPHADEVLRRGRALLAGEQRSVQRVAGTDRVPQSVRCQHNRVFAVQVVLPDVCFC